MKPKLITGLVVGVLFLIILIQNRDKVDLQIYFWTISLPQIILILVVLVVGFWGGFIAAKITGKKKNKKIPSTKGDL